jgi:hypothetical protein
MNSDTSSIEELYKNVDAPKNTLRHRVRRFQQEYSYLTVWLVTKIVFTLGFLSYLGYAIYYVVSNDLSWEWCDGLGFIIILTSLACIWNFLKVLRTF